MLKTCLALCLAMVLAGCGAPTPRPAVTGPVGAAREPAAGVPVYRIDPSRSELRLLVYRAGRMERFGHNHVIVNRAVSGWVTLASDGTSAAFSLRVPVAEFIVDDAQSRAQEGADFADEVTVDAKAGTLRNMLSDAVLDGERFPFITMDSVDVRPQTGTPVVSSRGVRDQPGTPVVSSRGTREQPDTPVVSSRGTREQTSTSVANDVGVPRGNSTSLATVAVRVAGHDATLQVPFAIEISPGTVSGSGAFTLRQSDLGLTPFSVMLGALQVRNDMAVKFETGGGRLSWNFRLSGIRGTRGDQPTLEQNSLQRRTPDSHLDGQ